MAYKDLLGRPWVVRLSQFILAVIIMGMSQISFADGCSIAVGGAQNPTSQFLSLIGDSVSQQFEGHANYHADIFSVGNMNAALEKGADYIVYFEPVGAGIRTQLRSVRANTLIAEQTFPSVVTLARSADQIGGLVDKYISALTSCKVK